MPRITQSQELVKELKLQIQSYLDTEFCELWQFSTKNPDLHLPSLEDSNFNEMYQKMATSNSFWSRNKEMSSLNFSSLLERKCLASMIALLVPMRFSVHEYGVLIVGKKKKGVFTLHEVETLRRTIAQASLSLEILHLLEKEKVLVEKTMEANLIALRAQINPHFLFNTFNSISELIHYAPEEAERVIEQLSYIFRYTLKMSNENFVTIENEFSLVTNYLQIEKVRLGKRLTFEVQMDAEVKNALIPAFVIQTFVENAIKHGVAKKIEGGKVIVSARKAGMQLECVVYDEGPGIDPQRITKGTGLNNVLLRLEKLYNGEASINFVKLNSGTEVKMLIPLQIQTT
jgi:LytS/YehU family sensor histidine kinase